MITYTLTQLKEKLGSIFQNVYRKGRIIYISRYNKPLAVILPYHKYKDLTRPTKTWSYSNINSVDEAVEYLQSQYPGKSIVLNKNKEGEVVEIICEVYNRADFSKAIAVIVKGALLHYHKTLTETYLVTHGRLRVWKDNKEYIVAEGEKITFKLYEKHKTAGSFVWLEVYSRPGWHFSDHILVDTAT